METKISPYFYAVSMAPSRMISVFGNGHLSDRTRVIYKVGSMVFYFSNRKIGYVVQFGRQQSGSLVIQLMTELDVSCN